MFNSQIPTTSYKKGKKGEKKGKKEKKGKIKRKKEINGKKEEKREKRRETGKKEQKLEKGGGNEKKDNGNLWFNSDNLTGFFKKIWWVWLQQDMV